MHSERYILITGRLTEQWLLNEDGSDVDALDRDPEGLIVAMERVTLLFDRLVQMNF